MRLAVFDAGIGSNGESVGSSYLGFANKSCSETRSQSPTVTVITLEIAHPHSDIQTSKFKSTMLRRVSSRLSNRKYSSWNDSSYARFILRMGKLQETLAKNVRTIRRARGMTQEDLADRAGLSSRYVGQVERAQTAATINVLEQLAEALGVEPAELVR